MWAFANPPLIPKVFVFEFELDAIFLLYSPLWYETRRNAFVGNFGLTKGEVEIDGVEIIVYYPPLLWPLEVNVMAAEGQISLSSPRCLYATFTPL